MNKFTVGEQLIINGYVDMEKEEILKAIDHSIALLADENDELEDLKTILKKLSLKIKNMSEEEIKNGELLYKKTPVEDDINDF